MKYIILLIFLIVIRAQTTQNESVTHLIASNFFFSLGIIIAIIEIIFYVVTLKGDKAVDFAIFTDPQQSNVNNPTSSHPADYLSNILSEDLSKRNASSMDSSGTGTSEPRLD